MSLKATANIDKDGLLEYELFTKKKGLTIEKNEDGTYKVTAQKTGTYTLTANAYVKEYNENNEPVRGRKILTSTYKITAVKEEQVREIQLTTDSEEFAINEDGAIGYVSTSEMKDKTFTIKADVLGADKNALNTALEWTVTNEEVATLSYDKEDTHKVVVTLKDYGMAFIKVKVMDKTGVNKVISLKIENGRPHLLTPRATINLAYNYATSSGENLAEENNGQITVAEGQGGEIKELCLWNDEGELDTRFGFIGEGKKYIVSPRYYDMPTGVYKLTLGIKSENFDEWCKYPIEISVMNKQPKVTAKVTQKVNLFYRYQKGRIDFNVEGLCYMGHIYWVDNSNEENGFELKAWDTSDTYRSIEHKNVKLKGTKLADAKCAKGTLYINLRGYREPVVIKNFKMDYTYKKPSVTLDGGQTKYVMPETGADSFDVKLYDPLTEQYLQKVDSSSYTEANYYHRIESNSKNVRTSCAGTDLTVEYLGKKNKETVTYTIDSLAWREPLKVKYTIQVEKATASLETNSIVCNKNIQSSFRTTILMGKKQPMSKVAGVKYSGADAKSEELIQSGILELVNNAADLDIKYYSGKQLQADKEVKAGTYTFKVTPYYIHEKTGKILDANTITLKVKLTDKPVSAKVTVKGTYDLVMHKPTAILQVKFSNMDSSYQIKSAKLIGEGTELFGIKKDSSKGDAITNSYYLYSEIQKHNWDLIKAGTTYPFVVEYTVQATNRADGSEGETFVVRSNPIKIKTKQSVPKIKLSKNNITTYVTRGEVDLNTKLIMPEECAIAALNGAVDINKDGKIDMAVEISPYYRGYENLRLWVYDEKVVATPKRKTYTVPIRITLSGSDGLSKEPVVNLKLTLKR